MPLAILTHASAPRTDVGSLVYYVLNRTNAGATLFADEVDYRRFTERRAEEPARRDAAVRLVPDARPRAARPVAARAASSAASPGG